VREREVKTKSEIERERERMCVCVFYVCERGREEAKFQSIQYSHWLREGEEA